MRVYALMHYGGYDESNHVLGVFASRRHAQETLRRMNSVPSSESTYPPEGEGPGLSHHAERRMVIEGQEHEYINHQLRWASDKPPKVWPPKVPVGIVEWEVCTAPLIVTPSVPR